MKKIHNYLLMALMAVACVATFSSCEPESEEEAVARTLEGDWQGTMNEFFYTRWGHYLSGGTFYTNFTFERSSPTSGWGTEVDEDGFGNMVERDFTWHVEYPYGSSHFDIYLRYDSRFYYYDVREDWSYELHSDPYDAVIYDAYLDGDYFEGYLEDSDGVRKYFRLRYVGHVRSTTRSARTQSGKPVVVVEKNTEDTGLNAESSVE